MSGFEIAGVVLGAFPIVVHLAEGYAKGLTTIQGWSRYKSDVNRIRLNLGVERIRFLTTCEQLFEDIATPAERGSLLAGVDTAGLVWAKHEEQLKRRLGHSYESYIATVSDTRDALEKLKEFLNRQVENPNSRPKRSRRIRFILSKAKQEELLHRIEENNKMLSSLLEQNGRLESKRKRTTTPGYRRIRQHCTSLYSALTEAWGCCCNANHIANVHLPSIMGNKTPLLSDIRLQIIFQAMMDHNNVTTKWQWQQAYMQSIEVQAPKPVGTSASVSTISSQNSKQSPWKKAKKSVKFALPTSEPQLSSSTSTLTLPVLPPKPPSPPLTPTKDFSGLVKISSLCATFSSSSSQKAPVAGPGSCIGYLEDDRSGLHGLHLVPSDVDWEVISLRDTIKMYLSDASKPHQALDGHSFSSSTPVRSLTRKERFALAVTISTSVLQFDDTPWLQRSWGTDDVNFLVKPFSSIPDQACLSAVFSSNPQPTDQGRTCFPPLIRNKALYALGIVLIELAFGKPLEEMRTDEDIENSRETPKLVDAYTAERLMKSVEDEAGSYYEEAVRHCIKCQFDGKEARFANESFQDAVYDGIVEPLQMNLKNFSGGSTRTLSF
ncbi:hypothetical protein AJ79_05886 [Helicocarpus griseus UAMH5409]|uniref:DUF7580 domain-containing protein n=1 Tax=Helicocarpus griseus UAMH5409 TaxID=1447875 RepID=A0A2B7XJI1_9EURO|nr:hypothetical protein AJ79_05886 [Helicocarpus griseus UAMH5409]